MLSKCINTAGERPSARYRGGRGQGGKQHKSRSVSRFLTVGCGLGEGRAPGATFPRSCGGRKGLRALDCGFSLQRKRNSLEATEEQLIHNSSNLKKSQLTLWGLELSCVPSRTSQPCHRGRRQDASSDSLTLSGWRDGWNRPIQPGRSCAPDSGCHSHGSGRK